MSELKKAYSVADSLRAAADHIDGMLREATDRHDVELQIAYLAGMGKSNAWLEMWSRECGGARLRTENQIRRIVESLRKEFQNETRQLG